MCGRYVLFTDEEEDDIADIVRDIQQKLQGEAKGSLASGEIFPTNNAPLLTAQGSAAMVWGLPGYKGSGVIINARSETVHEKPLFRSAMLSRRCIVLSHGFFEWRKPATGEKNKEKLLFRLDGEKTLYMAGLYNVYPDGARFAILTTAANEVMRPIHDRMPVIIPKMACADYLHDANAAREILKNVPPAAIIVN